MRHWSHRLDDGSVVFLEVEEVERGVGPQPVSRVSDALEKAGRSLEQSLDAARRLAGQIVDTFRSVAPEEPDEIQVAFGLKASAEVQGFAVAKASAEANYTVTLKWVRRPHDGRDRSDS